MNPDIVAFIEHARSKGMDHGTIRMLLLSAGWKEKDVARALADHALEMSVPVPPDTGGARDAFMYLSAFAALYASAFGAVSLLFDYVNRMFPDPAMGDAARMNEWALRGMRWSLATLMVSFPLFIILSRFLLNEMATQLEKSWSAIRRWLTYLTLFIAAVTLASDVVTLVFYLLEGELSVRFLLKVVIVGVVASLAFVYYLATVRMPARVVVTSPMHRRFGGTATAIALLTCVWGVVIVGSPGAARNLKLDDRRVQDLTRIESAIERFCLGPPEVRKEGPPQALVKPLPATLGDLARAAVANRPSIADPSTGAAYEYQITGASSFELCATFSGARDDDDAPVWNHPAGRHCFKFDVLAPK